MVSTNAAVIFTVVTEVSAALAIVSAIVKAVGYSGGAYSCVVQVEVVLSIIVIVVVVVVAEAAAALSNISTCSTQ